MPEITIKHDANERVIGLGADAEEAGRQRVLAAAEREAAELAAAAAAAAGNYYPSVAAGEAATATDGLFSTDDGAGNLIYYRRTAGGSTEIARAVTSSTLDDYAQRSGGETSVSGRYGFTNLSAFAGSPEAVLQVINDTITAAGPAIGLNVKQYWQGSAASPLTNNDCTLFETYTKTVDNSSNITWSVSAPNAYYDIPAFIIDSGERISLYGWAVSVPGKPGYVHAGTLGTQKGVVGAAGFRGTHVGTARVISAIGVVGEIESESGTIENAFAGLFRSAVGAGTVLANTAVYAKATGGTNSNHGLYVDGGAVFSKDQVRLQNELGQTNASLVARRDGNSVEFGSTDPAGYSSTIGATAASGFPFLAFHAKASDTGDTFDTDGIAGSVITTDLAGALRIARATNANADGQSLTSSATFAANGDIFFGVHASLEGGVFVPGSDNGRDMGIAGSDRWRDLFIVNAPTVGSDEREKTAREEEGPTDAERAWARAIRLVCYRRNEAIEEKGRDGARLHWGVMAQQVHKAGIEAGIDDPFAYGFLCRDELTELKQVPVKVERVRMKEIEEEESDPRPVDDLLKEGAALLSPKGGLIRRKVKRMEPVTREETVLGEDGEPVMREEDGSDSPILTGAGDEKVKRAPRMVPVTRRVPVTRTVTEMREQRVPVLGEDGEPEVRWSIRYEELLTFLLACACRDV